MARVTRRWSASVVPLIVAAVMIVAAAAAGCSEQEQSGKPLHAPEWLDPTLAGWVACSRMIVAGDVVNVRPAGHGRMVTELAVDEWVKPASGPEVATIETADLAAEGVYERWKPGTHLFLQVDVDPASLPGWEFSDRMIKKIKRAVPASRTIDVPVRSGLRGETARARRSMRGRGRARRRRGIRTSGSRPAR